MNKISFPYISQYYKIMLVNNIMIIRNITCENGKQNINFISL